MLSLPAGHDVMWLFPFQRELYSVVMLIGTYPVVGMESAVAIFTNEFISQYLDWMELPLYMR